MPSSLRRSISPSSLQVSLHYVLERREKGQRKERKNNSTTTETLSFFMLPHLLNVFFSPESLAKFWRKCRRKSVASNSMFYPILASSFSLFNLFFLFFLLSRVEEGLPWHCVAEAMHFMDSGNFWSFCRIMS